MSSCPRRAAARAVASLLGAALLIVSPGLPAYEAAAQVLNSGAAVEASPGAAVGSAASGGAVPPISISGAGLAQLGRIGSTLGPFQNSLGAVVPRAVHAPFVAPEALRPSPTAVSPIDSNPVSGADPGAAARPTPPEASTMRASAANVTPSRRIASPSEASAIHPLSQPRPPTPGSSAALREPAAAPPAPVSARLSDVAAVSASIRSRLNDVSPAEAKTRADFTLRTARVSGEEPASVQTEGVPAPPSLALSRAGGRGTGREPPDAIPRTGAQARTIPEPGDGSAAGPAPRWRTSARGQFLWAGLAASRAGLLAWAGADLLSGHFLTWSAPWLAWLAPPALGLAALSAVAALGYAALGARIGAAMWRHLRGPPTAAAGPDADPAASSTPSRGLLRRALSRPIATPREASPALATLPEHARFVVEAHEQAHRDGRGEIAAYLRQAVRHPAYLWNEGRALARGAGERAARAAATLVNFTMGDADLAHLIKPLRGKMAFVGAMQLAGAGLALWTTVLIGRLLDIARLAATHGAVSQAGPLWSTAGLLALAFAAGLTTQWLGVYHGRILGLWAAFRYRVGLTRSLENQEMAFHLEEKHGSGALAGRILNDTNYLSLKNVTLRLELPLNVFLLAVGGALFFSKSLAISAVVVAIVLPLTVLYGRMGKKLVDISFEQTNKKSLLNQRIQESLQHVQTVKSFAALEQELARYDERAGALRDQDLAEARVRSRLAFFGLFISFFTQQFVYMLGGWSLAGHLRTGPRPLSFGDVTQMTRYAGYSNIAVAGLTQDYLLYQQYTGAATTVHGLLTRQPAVADAPDAAALDSVRGELEFRNVAFGYAGREGAAPVLRDVSFRVKPGQTVGIVGATGSGKSTVAKLLLRLWDPSEGSVLVDGRDLRRVRRRDYLARVAVVPQDTKLFNDTLLYNITYGSLNAARESELTPEARARLGRAIRMAKADFVLDQSRFPEGLETFVAEGGKRLSGGERQRVSIARAILRGAPILILDEPTSKLDGPSENVVQGALEGMTHGADGLRPTTLYIAHRLPTVRHADAILVMDHGRVAESGTHEELLARGGLYARMWNDGGYDRPRDALAAGAPASESSEERAASAADVARTPEGPRPAEAPASAAAAAEPAAAGFRAPPATARRRTTDLWNSVRTVPAAIRGRLARAGADLRTFALGDAEIGPVLAPHRRAFRLAVGLLAADAVLTVALARVTGSLLSAALSSAGLGFLPPTAALWAASTAMLAIFAALLYIRPKSALLSGELKAKVKFDLGRELFRRFHRRELAFHMDRENNSGALAAHNTEDVESWATKNVSLRLPLPGNVILTVLSTALLLHTSWLIGLVVLATVVPLGIYNGVSGQSSERFYTEFGRRRAELGRGAQESFQHMQTVKSFGQEEHEVRRASERAEALAKAGAAGAKPMAKASVLTNQATEFVTENLIYILGAFLLAGVIVLGAGWGFSLGKIAELTFYAGLIKSGVNDLLSGWMNFKQMNGETDFDRRQFREEPAIRDRPGAGPLPAGPGDVRFDDVGFRYGANSAGRPVLDGVSFEAKPGETVAFVGESGSGKSTILNLLQRAWEPESGRVTIDGKDIRDVTLDSLNHAVALIPQETPLFDGSLRYNMLYGSEDATEEDLNAALRGGQAEFYKEFPQGLETRVGEGGNQLSGGQAQRVAIVRALLKLRKARILVLDEPTAALDTTTQAAIQATLDRIRAGEGMIKSAGGARRPTTLLVAHNLPTVVGADRIVVMDQGRVVDSGTHQELLRRSGAYQRLWDAYLKERSHQE